MLVDINNLTKTIGAKHLFKDISLSISNGEKIALIGRNGHGKTTLLNIIGDQDHDYEGHIKTQKGINITLTKQEHIHHENQTPLEYIIQNVPNYFEYKKILEDYEEGRSTNLELYLETLDKFTQYRYFNLVDAIKNTLSDFNIPIEFSDKPLAHLSGGQKRYMEITRMMFSQSHLLLIDEPTNHLDYVGKDRFISWMKSLKQSVIVVTHDRDVLKNVHKIVELKNKRLEIFKGNYDHYISNNASKTLSSVKDYSDQLRKLEEAKKRVEWGNRMRAKSKAWKIRYDHWLKDYEKIKSETVKPSFWIDQESVDNLDAKVTDSYEKFKERNINIKIEGDRERGMQHIIVRDLSLGYEKPVFENLNFSLVDDKRILIKGRNGAGKSTLVKTILSLSKNEEPATKIFEGSITLGNGIRIGEYQQEIDPAYLDLPLENAILQSYGEKNVPITTQGVKSLLSQYLFNPVLDANQKIRNLSGGQKARFQIIKMLINRPNVLILDEPTNHLDLPSIEELENALADFKGAILYISHDTYFIKKIGGDVIEI